MARFLVFSDLHLNNWKNGSTVDNITGNSRLTSQLKFIKYIAIYAESNEIEHILFCGDFFHTPGSIRTEVLHHAWRTLRLIKRKNPNLNFFWLEGNHDQADRDGRAFSTGFLEQFGEIVNYVYRDSVMDIDGIPVSGLPYTEDKYRLEKFLENVPNQSIVLLHQGVKGVEVNSRGFTINELLSPDMVPDKILHAFAGHYHSFKRVNDYLTIPGAPMQHNWGDTGEDRGFLDVLVDLNSVHIKFVPVEFTPKFSKVSYENLDELLGAPNNRSYDIYKIVGVPKGKQQEVASIFNKYNNIMYTMEMKAEGDNQIGSAEVEDFSSVFSEYVKANNITGRRLEIGNEIISGSYAVPSN